MTTIAYKDGVVAYDSRCTRGTTILDDDANKLHVVKEVSFLCTGATCDFAALIDGFFGNDAPNAVEASALAWDGTTLWLVGHDDKTGAWKDALELDRPHTIGSGANHALTAMDMGANAYKAVEMAAKRDTSTGGKIKTLIIKAE